MQQNWFKDWFNSPYYHILYFERDYDEAAQFIGKLIAHLHPAPQSKMLDVACGKGRHALEMWKLGFDVVGIDLSPESINAANEFANERLRFFVHDMRLPFMANYFDVAFNLFTSFGYFLSHHDNQSAMRMMAKSIKRNGVLVIDYLNARYAAHTSIPHQTKIIGGVEFEISKHSDETHFYKDIIVFDPSNGYRQKFSERVSKFSLAQFEKMFAEHGLKLLEVFGDYELKAYNPSTSPRMVMIASY